MIAARTYNLLQIRPQVDAKVLTLDEQIVGLYWPPERQMVENGYRDITLPFEVLKLPNFKMTTKSTLSQLLGYLSTWSAVKRYQKDTGENPIEINYEELTAAWGQTETYVVSWSLSVRVWRK